MNQESFDCFLKWLDIDRDEAAQKYEAIRRDLIKFFDGRVGAAVAEELADKTINTVIDRAPQLIDTYSGDPRYYVFRVAQFKRLEYIRWLAIHDGGPIINDIRDTQSYDAAVEKEVLSACLRECLQKLPEEERELLLRYYAGSGKGQLIERLELAALQNRSINALRLQIYRLKEKLRACIFDCRGRMENR
ncbi:MAG: hypothetical protein J2P52_16260 [Blastocatellia bacterium]|nr:hypothetical protein [Blastocatellia bacterium]